MTGDETMGREIRRVALDFEWPLREVWEGYLLPSELRMADCRQCEGSGYSEYAQGLYDLWYGKAHFRPQDHGSVPFDPSDPAILARAERNVGSDPGWGAQDLMVTREAIRLAKFYNGSLSHHLDADDVAALVEANRLWDLTRDWIPGTGWVDKDPPVVPTPDEVNQWSLQGSGHDEINAWVVVKARCERTGNPAECAGCAGSGSVEAYPGQRVARDAWEPTPPPAGEGWQVWETVTEGSPVTPVFATRQELVKHLCSPEQGVTLRPGAMSRHEAQAFVDAGWVPSGVSTPATGYVEGALVPAAQGTTTSSHD